MRVCTHNIYILIPYDQMMNYNKDGVCTLCIYEKNTLCIYRNTHYV